MIVHLKSFYLSIIFIVFIANANSLEVFSSKNINIISLNNDDYARYQYVDNDYNNYFIGKTNSIGNGEYDYLLIKTDRKGNLIYHRNLGGIGDDQAYFITFMNNNLYIAGRSNSFGNGEYDALIAKYDLEGNMIFSKFYGGPSNDYSKTIKKIDNGNLIFVGRTSSFKDNNLDAWAVEIDENGQLINNYIYGTIGYYDEFRNFVETSDSYFFVGHSHNLNNNKYCLDKNKDMLKQSKCMDAFIVKTDKNGINKNIIKYGSKSLHDSAKDIIQVNNEELLITGIIGKEDPNNNEIESKLLLLKINNEGDIIKDLSFEIGVYAVGYNLLLNTKTNDVYITGKTKSKEKNFDLFVASYNLNNENLNWLKLISKKGYEEGMSITLIDSYIQILGRSDSFKKKMDFISFKLDFEGNIID